MSELLTTLPHVLDLGSCAYGSCARLQKSFCLLNRTESHLVVVIEADRALLEASSSIRFRNEHVEGAPDSFPKLEAHSKKLFLLESSGDEDENYMERELMDNLESESVTLSIPPHSNVRVILSLTPALRSPISLQPGLPSDIDNGHEETRYRLEDVVGHLRIHTDVQCLDSSGKAEQPPIPSTSVLVKFLACESHIYVDTNELHFGACEPGKQYVKDFTIRNRSEIDTAFHISCSGDASGEEMEFFDYETGQRVENKMLQLSGYGHCHLRLSFLAQTKFVEVDRTWWFAIENVLNSRNVAYVKVTKYLSSKNSLEYIEMLPNERLNFGDCYAWEPKFRDVLLRNVSREPVVLSLSSSLSDQVCFELVSAEEKQDEEISTFWKTKISLVSSASRSFRDSAPSKEPRELSNNSAGRNSLQCALPGKAVMEEHGPVSDVGLDPDSSGRGVSSFEVHQIASAQDRTAKMESLAFREGQSRLIRVWYEPVSSCTKSESNVSLVGRLRKHAFQLMFRRTSGEMRVLPVESRVCESIVGASMQELNLGDCNVLTTYPATVTLYNMSDLPARIVVKCQSKSVALSVDAFEIGARQSYDFSLTYTPRKLNPDYVKQICFVNRNNLKRQETSITLRANNVDQRCISLHAVFYKVLDPAPTNEINFGCTVPNYLAVRAFRIQNVTEKPLVLGFDQSDNVVTFVPPWNLSRTEPVISVVAQEELSRDGHKLCESRKSDGAMGQESVILSDHHVTARNSPQFMQEECLNGREMSGRSCSGASDISRDLYSLLDLDDIRSVMDGSTEEENAMKSNSTRRHEGRDMQHLYGISSYVYSLPCSSLTPAAPARSLENVLEGGLGDNAHSSSKFSMEERGNLIQRWTETEFPPISLLADVFSSIEEEVEYAERMLRPGSTLLSAIQNGSLVRADHLVLEGGEETVVCAAVTITTDTGQRRGLEVPLLIRLVDYDVARIESRLRASTWRGSMFSEASFDDLPPRELVLSVQVLRAQFDIRPLRSFNFGAITAGSQRHRHFVIDNCNSSSSLVFTIRKSRSVASGDIRLGNGYDTGRLGVVRPLTTTTIPFVFRPSLAGTFCESLDILNVLDPASSAALTIKANVQKRSNFHLVAHTQTDFGVIHCGVESSHSLRLDICNDSEKTRKFSVSVVDRSRSSGLTLQPIVLIYLVDADVDLCKSIQGLDASAVEELQGKEKKLLHYETKGKAAKAEILRKEIEALRSFIAAKNFVGNPEDGSNSGILDGKTFASSVVFENHATFDLDAHGTQRVEVRLLVRRHRAITQSASTHFEDSSSRHVEVKHARARTDMPAGIERLDRLALSPTSRFNFTLGVYESKDRDSCHSINCGVEVTTPLKRSESSLSSSELIIPPDFDDGHFAEDDPSIVGPVINDNGTLARQPVTDMPHIDFGEIDIGVSVRRAVQIRNMSDRRTAFEVFLPATPVFLLNRSIGDNQVPSSMSIVEAVGLSEPIEPGQQITFYITFTPLAKGCHSRLLVLAPREGREEDAEHRIVLSAAGSTGSVYRVETTVDTSVDPLFKDAKLFRSRNQSDVKEHGLGKWMFLGFGLVDQIRKYAIVRRLTVLSEVDIDVEVSVCSNLTFQVLLFADENLSTPASSHKLVARGFMNLWIGIAPRLRSSEMSQGTAREIVGGLHLLARYNDIKLLDSVIRFAAVVAVGPIEVTPGQLDLGWHHNKASSQPMVLSGSFRIENVSTDVQLKYDLEASSPNVNVLGTVSGDLAVRSTAQERAKSAYIVDKSFVMRVSRTGILSEWIRVNNVYCPSLSKTVHIRAFVDPGRLSGTLTFLDFGQDTPIIYVSNSDGEWYVSTGGRIRWSVVLIDDIDFDSEMLVPVTTAPYTICTELQGISDEHVAKVMDARHNKFCLDTGDVSFVECGPSLSFSGAKSIELYANPCVPKALREEHESNLRNGNLVDAGGVLALRSLIVASDGTDQGDIAESVVLYHEVSSMYCLSYLAFLLDHKTSPGTELAADKNSDHCIHTHEACDTLVGRNEPVRLNSLISDVGRFGHCSGWREEIVCSKILNCTAAPLFFGFEDFPPGFTLEGVIGDNVTVDPECLRNGDRDFIVGANASAVIKIRLCPRHFCAKSEIGSETVEGYINVINKMNPSGGLSWTIRGTLTGPRLRFDGLNEIDLRSRTTQMDNGSDILPQNCFLLILPEISLPVESASSSAFSVCNMSDTRITLRATFKYFQNINSNSSEHSAFRLFDVTISEDLSGVELYECSLNSNESMGVRVRALPESCVEDEKLLERLFRGRKHHEEIVGHIQFDCKIGDVLEPAGSIEVHVRCKRGDVIRASSTELFVNGFVSDEIVADIAGGRVLDAADVLASNQLKLLRLSNGLSHSSRRFHAQMSDCPSGAMPVIYPRSGVIDPGCDVKLLVGFVSNCRNSASLYGQASLAVFDKTSHSCNDLFEKNLPAAVIAVHLNAAEDLCRASADETGRAVEAGLDDNKVTDKEPSRVRATSRPSEKPQTAGSTPSGTASPSANSAFSTVPSPSTLPVVESSSTSSAPSVGDSRLSHLLSEILPPSRGNLESSWRDTSSNDQTATSPSHLEGIQETNAAVWNDLLVLKGCARVAGDPCRYDLDCGQFLVGRDPFVCKLTVENRSQTTFEYYCSRTRPWSSTLGHADTESLPREDSWLGLSRSGGILSPSGHKGDKQTLFLKLNREEIGIFSTYLLIESPDEDVIRTIRVHMEVVADGVDTAVAQSFFSVLCDGRGTDLHLIDYSIVMFDQLYRHRSFVVQNECDVTLEFVLSSDLPDSALSELTFSMTNAVLRNTSRLVIPPREKQRVFLLYRPLIEAGEQFEPDEELQRSFNVFVTCRLVKDYQVTIKILSKCRQPSLSLSRSEVFFDCAEAVRQALGTANQLNPAQFPSNANVVAQAHATAAGSLSSSDDSTLLGHVNNSSRATLTSAGRQTLELQRRADSTQRYRVEWPTAECTIEIRGRKACEPITYVIKNNTQFFEVDKLEDRVSCDRVDNDTPHKVTVRPNYARIREQAHYLYREKYIEEHITIYNRNFPREFFWVRIRLTVGGAASEFSSVSHKRGFSFSSLESIVVSFLSTFARFWSQFRRKHFHQSADTTVSTEQVDDQSDNRSQESEHSTASIDVKEDLAAWAARVATAPLTQGYDTVLFELHYTTDELVYYMLKSASKQGLQLASMLYSYMFKHDVFATFLQPEGLHLRVPEMMISWVGQLGHFLSFFPDKRYDFRGLTELQHEFTTRMT